MEVEFTLTPTPLANANLNLIILTSDCSTESCIASTAGVTLAGEQFTTELEAGNYFIVVDGASSLFDFNSDFTLEIDCINLQNTPPCISTAGEFLGCESSIMGSLPETSTSLAHNRSEYCAAVDQHAFEDHYSLSFQYQTAINIKANSDDFDINLFLLNSCDPSDCVTAFDGNTVGNEDVFIDIPSGNYILIVDGSTTDAVTPAGDYELELNCLSNELDCNAISEINCGDVIYDTTEEPTSLTNNNLIWCNNAGYLGFEKTYQFIVNKITVVDISLSLLSGSGNHDVYITSPCDNDACVPDNNGNIDYGANPGDEQFTFEFAPGTYFIHVDTEDGFGEFELLFECRNELNCNSITTINCGELIISTTLMQSPNQNNVEKYCLSNFDNETGFEQIFEFETLEKQTVQIEVSSLTPGANFDFFILTDCENTESCIMDELGLEIAAVTDGDESLLITLEPGTYYIIVDSYLSEGDFELAIHCDALDCTDIQPLIPNTLTFKTNDPTIHPSDVYQYECATFPTPGPEVIYSLQNTNASNTIHVVQTYPVSEISPPGDMDLMFFFSDCGDQDFCLSSQKLQEEFESIGTDIPSNQTRYYTIDSKNPEGGEYYLLTYSSEPVDGDTYLGSLNSSMDNDVRLRNIALGCESIIIPNNAISYHKASEEFLLAKKNINIPFSYELQCTLCDDLYQTVLVFVDVNNDGFFEDTELRFQSNDFNHIGNITFTGLPFENYISTMRIVVLSTRTDNLLNRLDLNSMGNVSYELNGITIDVPLRFYIDDNDQGYCNSIGCSPPITEMSINGKSHQSGDDFGYGDYSTFDFIVHPGANNLFASPNGTTGDPDFDGLYRIWIDYNEDFIFDDNEIVYDDAILFDSVNLNLQFSGMGNATMRVQYHSPCGQSICDYGILNPCLTNFEGEVHDYSVLLDASVSVNDVENNISLNIYPNPSSSYVDIGISYHQTISNSYKIKIVNIEGKVVHFQNIRDPHIRISTSSFLSGLYFVIVNSKDGNITKKFLKI